MFEPEQVIAALAEAIEEQDIKLCKPCLEIKESKHAVHFCQTCKELLCGDCLKRHKTSQYTKLHTVITIEEKQMQDLIKCDPCFSNETTKEASCFCTVCKQYLCDACKVMHGRFKVTKAHKIVKKDKAQSNTDSAPANFCLCDPCKLDGCENSANKYCSECRQYMCDDCVKAHKTFQATRHHKMVLNADHVEIKSKNNLCGPCAALGQANAFTLYCDECEEYLCNDCTRMHGVQKKTKHHKLAEPRLKEENNTTLNIDCEPCKELNKIGRADFYCIKCEENMCCACKDFHCAQKKSRDHEYLNAEEFYRKNTQSCDICSKIKDDPPVSEIYCEDCEEFLCTECKIRHNASKNSKKHNYMPSSKARHVSQCTRISCEPCYAMGIASAAVAFCIDCENEAFCAICLERHLVQKANKCHRTTGDLQCDREQKTTEE